MKMLKMMKRLLEFVVMPLCRNKAFFVFMYLLGCLTAWATLPNARGAKLYDNLYLELFLDVYVLAAVLTVLVDNHQSRLHCGHDILPLVLIMHWRFLLNRRF